MRPILWNVDETATPPQMTICFPGDPHRAITVRIREPVTTRHEATVAAMRELHALTELQIELLRESSTPLEHPDPAPTFGVMATIEPVTQEPRYAGAVHCPACCRRLGRGDSPVIGYLEQCPGCLRRLKIQFTARSVCVFLWTE